MENSRSLNVTQEPAGNPLTTLNQESTYSQKVLWLIAAMMLLKGFAAFVLELGNDESYYWFYSQDLKWNYFDHPPMVSVWVRLFTLNLWLQDYPGFIRLGSIIGSAAATWAMYKTVATLHSERGGWFAAILYNASFYAGLSAGLFVMPDAPQMVFWTFSLWMLAHIVKDENNRKTWLLFGIAAGLCIMSKVHGVFIYFGLGLFMLLRRRNWFLKPNFYLAVLISILITSPILIWNLQNNFASYRFHSERVTLDETIEGLPFVKEVLNQFFFNNPFNVALIFTALVRGYRYRAKRFPALTLFNCIAWPLAGSLLFVSLFRDATLPHWSGPAYVTFIPMAAIYLTQLSQKPLWPRWLRWSLGTFVATLFAYLMLVQFYPGTLGKKNGPELGKGDNTLDVYGWKAAADSFQVFYKKEVEAGLMPQDAPVVCAKWWGAHVEYYFCRPLQLEMFGLGTMNLLHEYMWMNKKRIEGTSLASAYCIIPSDELYDVQKTYGAYYSKIQLVKRIETFRSHQPAHYFYVYRLTGWKGGLPVAP